MEYENMTSRSTDESESSHEGSSGSEETIRVGRLSPQPRSRSPRFPEDMYDVIECIPRSFPRVSPRRGKTEEEPTMGFGGSARRDNFFTCLPTEILENEILRWLSPVGGVALVMACGLTVSTAARPTLFIRWKHPGGVRNNITLKMEARDPAEKRALVSFGCKLRETNPADDVYEAVYDGKIPRISEPRDYAMAIALGCDIKNLSVKTHICVLGMLMAGQTPNLCDVVSIERYRASLKDIPERPLLEYVFNGAAVGIVSESEVRNIIDDRYNNDPIRCCHVVDMLLEKQIAVMSQYGRWSWNNIPIAVYKHMLRSGYMWFLITERAGYCTFSDVNDLRWGELAADIPPHVEAFGKYISVNVFGYMKGSRLSRRLEGVVKICGAYGALEMVNSHHNGPYIVQTATALRGLLGDKAFTQLTTPYPRVYVASGAAYIPLRAGCGDVFRWCIQYDNPTFLRGYLQDNPTLEFDAAYSDSLYRPCFKLGRAECLVVLLERNITISPQRIQILMASCTSRNILNLFA